MHTFADSTPHAADPGDEEVFVFPLSFAQQRLWFIDRMEPGNPFYNVPATLRLEGRLDVDALARALGEIVRRHETLRTVFDVEDGEPVQLVLPWRPVPLPVHDLAALGEAERTAEVERLAAAQARRPFDLETGPLFRAELLRLGQEDHVLLLCMHHVVSDGWSIGVLLRELSALQRAFARGEESPLAELPIQYADFAIWQRERLSGERLEAQLAYWREQLRDPPTLELPTDRPRPPLPSYRGATVDLAVPATTAGALRELARAEGGTLFMPLLAAFQVLLGRYAGQEDVVAGTPIANRNRGEIEGLIGFFVNALALRADLSGNPTFRALLRQVRERTFGAYAHQDLPFEKVVEELAPERDLSRTPVFQAMFSLQNAPPPEPDAGELRVSVYGGALEVAKWDLTLTLVETGEEIHGALAYATDLFDAPTAERIAAHYGALLAGIAADPDRRVAELPLMDAAERRRVLHGWNATAGAYDLRPVHERIAEQAARTPDAVAVVSPAGRLTYAELLQRAALLADRLRGAGVGPDDRVGVLLERGEEMVAGVLGILGAGAAYVALDPSYPDDRLRFVLDDAGAVAVVTSGVLAERIAGYGGAVVETPLPPAGTPHPRAPSPTRGEGEHDNGPAREALPHSWGRVASPSEPGGGLLPDASPPSPDRESKAPLPLAGEGLGRGPSLDNLAYVIYTSGSTGTPKGVLVTHRGLANYLAWFDEAVLGAEGLDLPLVSRLGFDAHVRQLFPPLLRGEAVWVLPDETVTDPQALLEALAGRERASFGGVPSLWSAMLERIRAGEAPKPRGLRAVLLGGEALPAELVERTFALFPDVALWNHYGPTEATVNTTVARVRPGEPVRIGEPVANVRVYLLDARGEPVPVGVPGELYVGGAGVARGYLGRPELTAERFVPDPFSGESGARMYRSGDRVRRGADGPLEYLGRTDFQVKVRGFRIEPGEIEAALERHPRVREAAVVVREDAPGAARLVGYVVPEGGAAVDPAELRDFLAERLPEYMVPAATVVLERFPLSPNGKVDRKALPAPDADGGAGEAPEPRTPTEEMVAGIYAEVLQLPRVGPQDDFFALGGHSLLATRVVSRVRALFGAELPLRTVFEAPGVAALAERVDAAVRAGVGTAAPPLVPVPRDLPLPASFAQQRLWFIQQMEPRSSAYNMPYALRLRGALDVGAMEQALDALRARHESLRTVFAMGEDGPVQVVSAPQPRPLPVADLRGLPEHLRAEEARRRVRAEAVHPFDLERGPPVRAGLLRLGDEEWTLLLTLHHVVSDGWSTGILTRELSVFYAGFARGEEVRLPELPVQYPDYAVWQRGWLTGEALERQLGWWRERLAGAPPLLELPTDRPRPPVPDPRGAVRPFALSPAATTALRELSRREGVTLFMALLAGWQALLARYSGQDDVSVGSPVAGRTRLELERLIGFFVNTLVLRADLSARPDFRTLLRQVRETTLGAYAHQDIPFEKLVEELRPERSLQHSPLFQVLFVLQNNADAELRLPALEVEAQGGAGETAHFDLGLALAEADDHLVGAASYRTELFDAETVDRMLRHLAVLLERAAAEPDRPLADLEILDDAERRQLLEWGAAGAPAAADSCVHEVFAEQAARTPDAVAVVHGEDRLSYGELNARSDCLAESLRRLGVGPETRVGLCLERGPELLVGVLGTWKAGGAYVPLDPAYPAERLAFMLEDAAAPVLVVQPHLAAGLPASGATMVTVEGTPLPPAPSPTRGEGEHNHGTAQEALPHSWGRVASLSEPGGGLSDLAYVIYTSGSTGRPKGVRITHGALANTLLSAGRAFGFGAGDTMPALASFAFDIWLFEAVLPLLHGGTVRVVPRERVVDVAALVEEISDATLLHAVPALMRQVVERVRETRGTLPGLRRAFVGGDAVPPDLLPRMTGVFPAAEVRVLYGPTEGTIICAAHLFSEAEAGERHLLGTPIGNAPLYVLDPAGQPSPIGVAGELCIGGGSVARDYLGRPELTARQFVPDPFSAEPGARMYRTGDRARWGADGVLEFLGRVDNQVKIRGFRIEPGEVEAQLAAHPAVAEAVVLVREDVSGEKRLVGYVVPADKSLTSAELKTHLAGRLPEYMVPSAFVVLERFPLSPNGKTDRKALPAPGGAGEAEYVAPRTPTEEVLAGIWTDVLRRERVGVDDDFFALGGHSLLVMQVVSRVRTALGVELPVAAVFERPTVAALAPLVDEGGARPRRTGPIRRADRGARTIRDPG
jgi:amino acid adenylation domain-containing protein